MRALAAFAIALGLFALGAVARFVDGDEGYYLLAAKLSQLGREGYRDFFYPQSFGILWVQSAWMWIVGTGWEANRILSACCGAGLSTLVFLWVRQQRPARAWLAFGAVTFAGMSFAWFTVSKTYALTSFLLVAGLMLASTNSASVGRAVLAGVSLGVMGSVRALSIVAIPVAVVELFRKGARRRSRLAGFALGCALPWVGYLFVDRDGFYFGNVTYHSLRSHLARWEALLQKLKTILKLFLPWGDEGLSTLQTLPLFVWVGVAIARDVRRRTWCPWSATIVAVGLASLLPTPTHTQYFAVLVPLVVIKAFGTGSSTHERSRVWRLVSDRRYHVVYLGLLGLEILRYTVWPVNVPGVGAIEHADDWRIGTIRGVSSAIDAATRQCASAMALAHWSGYLLESSALPVAGFENHFGRRVHDRLTPAERARHHIRGEEDFAALVRGGRVPVLVVGNYAAPDRLQVAAARERLERLALRSGYSVTATIGSTRVLARCPARITGRREP